MEPFLVRHLMTNLVTSVRPEESLSTLYDLMADKNIRHMPVVNDDLSLHGLVTHRDLLGSAHFTEGELTHSQNSDILQQYKVSEIENTGVETISPDQEALEAAQILLENKFGCLPVVDGDNHLVGIITESDFVRHFIKHQQRDEEP